MFTWLPLEAHAQPRSQGSLLPVPTEQEKRRVGERTWEKYHQISRSGPLSATYDLGGLTFRKINETF